MAKVIFTLPQAEVELSGSNSDECLMMVAGGREPDSVWLKKAAKKNRIFCADKGAAVCFKAKLYPEILWGDCDSTSAELYREVQLYGTTVYRYPSEKDDTDLQLLLKEIPDGNLLCSGIWGGRFDHLYSNVFSLLRYKLNRRNQVVMADEKELMVFLSEGETVELKLKNKPYAISLLPLSIKTKVDFSGVHWPLKEAELEMLHPYAISNEAENESIFCKCYSGCVGLYCCFEKA